MMYPFLTLDDQTEIVHSQLLDDGSVKVYVEKPDAKDCFHHATCWLPGYTWEDVFGFTPADIAPLFQDAVEVENVWLPESFWHLLRTQA